MKLKSKELKQGGIVDAGTSINFKTGGWKVFKPKVDFNKCIHCMRCVAYCPDMCIEHKNGKRGKTNFEMCKGCGICAKICPVKAISMVKE